ncbi:MAG: LysE family translocator, partial [Candidatus Thioglobus sp.]|nr:LysE family translocator [Candidatus Thioglobus sp.]
SFLPIFIDLKHLTLATEIEVIVVVGLTVFFVLSLANVLGLKLRKSIENPIVIQRVNKATGITMMLVGIFVGLY